MKARAAMAVLFAVTMMLPACSGDDNNGDGDGSETGETVQVILNRTEYYPFDVAAVHLPRAAAEEEYTGSIGTEEVKARRFADSVLAVALPYLPAGEYTLSLQMGNSKAESRLKIMALPFVENPEEVIGEMQSVFAGVVEEAREADDPNVPLLTGLANVFNEQLPKLSATERQQLAAYLQAHPALKTGWKDMEARAGTRSLMEQRMEQLLVNTLKWAATTSALKLSVAALGLSVWSYTPSPWSTAFIAASAFSTVSCKYLSDRYGRKAISSVAFPEAIGYEGIWIPTRASTVDYTLTNGGELSFDVQIRYRSVAAEDVGNPAAPEAAKDMIATGEDYSSVWDELAGYINRLRTYISALSPLDGKVQKISSITAPLTETEAFESWTLQIVSGDVSVQQVDGKRYRFTTDSRQDVEFTFRLKAEGTESKLFSGLLKVPAQNVLYGKWKSAAAWTVHRSDGTTETQPQDVNYYTFSADLGGRLLHEWESGSGHDERYVSYSYDGDTNTGHILHGAIWNFSLQSETTLVQTYSYDRGGTETIYWTFTKIE